MIKKTLCKSSAFGAPFLVDVYLECTDIHKSCESQMCKYVKTSEPIWQICMKKSQNGFKKDDFVTSISFAVLDYGLFS